MYYIVPDPLFLSFHIRKQIIHLGCPEGKKFHTPLKDNSVTNILYCIVLYHIYIPTTLSGFCHSIHIALEGPQGRDFMQRIYLCQSLYTCAVFCLTSSLAIIKISVPVLWGSQLIILQINHNCFLYNDPHIVVSRMKSQVHGYFSGSQT